MFLTTILLLLAVGWIAARWATRAAEATERRRAGDAVRDVQAALFEELVVLRMQAARFADELARQMQDRSSGWDRARLDRWRLTHPFAYGSFAGQAYLLPPDQAHRVRYFHLMLADARERAAPLLKGAELVCEPYILLRTLTTACNAIEPALREMAADLGQAAVAEPQMRAADAEVERLETEGLVEPVDLEWIYWPTLFEARPRRRRGSSNQADTRASEPKEIPDG